MKRVMWMSAICGVALGSALLVAAGQQTADSYSGGSDFQTYCSSCHGATAKGDGQLAGSLRKKPADLTQLSKSNDGVFPTERVTKSITEGHEKADMPAWAEVFAKSRESEGAAAARLRMEALVKYLETLQPKP